MLTHQKLQAFDDVITDTKKNCCRKVNISHKAKALTKIVQKYLNNIFEVKRSISVENTGAHLTLNISGTRDLEPMRAQGIRDVKSIMG